MVKLTKAKARELVKRELGTDLSRKLELDPSVPRNPQHPWYRADTGELSVTVYTLEDGQVIHLLLQYGCSSISTHFFTDTLEAFYIYSEMEESQNADDHTGETSDRTRRCRSDVKHELYTHSHKPAIPVRRCRVCGCTDYRACAGGCHWVESDLCSSCRDAGQLL